MGFTVRCKGWTVDAGSTKKGIFSLSSGPNLLDCIAGAISIALEQAERESLWVEGCQEPLMMLNMEVTSWEG